MSAPVPRRHVPGMVGLPFGIVILLTGLWGGLARLGYRLPVDGSSAAEHGVLMSLGFLGTLISIERAVALGRRWAWAVPAASVAGSAWLVAGHQPRVGQALLLVAGVVLVAVYARLDRIQRSTHNTLMGIAAVGWAMAAALWLMGRGIGHTVPWLAVFLVITITAERLELSRMLKRSVPVRASLIAAVLVMVAGATVSIWAGDAGVRLCGIAMVGMAAWLGAFDLARRTVRRTGVTRFMAAGLLAGYVWLAAGGILWASKGFQLDDATYDAQLHTVFLGFVMSMVFAHAPVIAPAVVRRPLPYYPAFYAPLALLHVGLLLRVIVGDGAGVTAAWQLGGILNEVAILGFVGVTIGAFVRARRARRPGAAADPRHSGPPSVPEAIPARRKALLLGSGVAGAVLGVAILVAAVVVANSGSPAAGATGEATGSAVSAAEAAAGVSISLVEMRIEPSSIAVQPGSHLVLRVTNNGTMRHDLRLSTGAQTPMLDPGQTAVLDAGVVTAPLSGWCTVPGHRQAGMTMQIRLAGSADATAPDPGSGGMPGMAGMPGLGGTGPTTGAPSPAGGSEPDASAADLAATPPAGWKPVDPTLPPVPAGTVHDVTWHITDVETEVAPGVRQLMWTFDGRVPGPVLHGRVGDTFHVTVVNDTAMTHNLDFHAESGPPAEVMTPIPPGGTHTYTFVATHAGAWLYHCSVEPMLMHLGNGMYGALVVDPPDLAPAARQYVLVGSELFFGPQGRVGDYAKMLADKPDAVVFNGYPFAYQHVPLQAKAGELVRIWVVDAGPTRSLVFHVVGAPFTTVYLDGAYLLRDGTSGGVTSGAAQTLPVDPGDGGFVELTFSRPGSYPFLTHAMADAVLGADGTVTVTR